MKRLGIASLLIAIVMTHIFAQDNALYDVNYDKPGKTANYDDSFAEFQKIYLQYEDAIKTTSTIIRQEERDTYNKELEKFKEEERIRTDTTIEKMRLAIYGNEVESVRKEETERLTAELTEKISADLNLKLSAEYEKIKNDEIEKIYAELKKQAYDETNATTQRVKSISSASAQVIIVILIIALIFIGIRAIISRIKRKTEEKEKFDTLVTLYSYQLKDYNGNTYHITQKIEKECIKNEKEKNLRMKALKVAENHYSGNLKELQEYEDEFESYKKKFSLYMGDNIWKNDKFDFNKISVELKAIYKNYKTTGQELFYSLESRTDADKRDSKNLLSITSSELKDLSNDLDKKTIDKQSSKEKKQLAKDFAKLAKSFEKGEF